MCCISDLLGTTSLWIRAGPLTCFTNQIQQKQFRTISKAESIELTRFRFHFWILILWSNTMCRRYGFPKLSCHETAQTIQKERCMIARYTKRLLSSISQSAQTLVECSQANDSSQSHLEENYQVLQIPHLQWYEKIKCCCKSLFLEFLVFQSKLSKVEIVTYKQGAIVINL